MDQKTFKTICKSLPHTTHVVQWGGSDVWKIGGKLFAVGSSQEGEAYYVTFKCSPTSFEIMKDQPGIRPALYLASRGMKWLQLTSHDTLSEDDLKAYIEASYKLVGAGLTKKLQRELGLLTD